MAITLKAWRDAIISTLTAEFTAKGLPVSYIGEKDPADLLDANGQPIVETPAIILYRGPFSVRLRDMGLSGRCYQATDYQWQAYCIASARSADPLLACDEMTNIVRAVLMANKDWGLGGGVLEPELEGVEGEQINIQLPGHTCRVIRWQQAARLVDGYT